MNEKVIAAIKESLEIEDREVTENDKFKEFEEWDSLANLTLISALDEEFGVVIPTEVFNELETVSDLIKEIESRK